MRTTVVHGGQIHITMLGRDLKIDLGGIHRETMFFDVFWEVPKYAYSIHNYT